MTPNSAWPDITPFPSRSLGTTVVGTYGVGTNPQAIAFDGANIWVANYFSNNIMKLNPSTGAVVGTYGVGNPLSIAFDGANIWVTNNGSNNVTKLSLNGTNLGTFAVPPAPSGVAFDGTKIWVTYFYRVARR